MDKTRKKSNFLIYEIVLIVAVIVVAIVIIHEIVPASPSLALQSFIHTVPTGVSVYASNNSIVISSNVSIPIVAYENISYNPIHNITYPKVITASDSYLATPNGELPYFDSFGLIDPTLVINKDVNVTFVFINLGSEIHIFAITPTAPPFNPFTTLSPQSLKSDLLYLPALPPPQNSANPFSGDIYSVSGSYDFNTTGTYYYLCPIPGHAELGMYGKVEVV